MEKIIKYSEGILEGTSQQGLTEGLTLHLHVSSVCPQDVPGRKGRGQSENQAGPARSPGTHCCLGNMALEHDYSP